MATVELTLDQLYYAILQLESNERQELLNRLAGTTVPCKEENGSAPNVVKHSILNIKPARVGRLFNPLTADDDLLGEMLESHS